MRGLLAVLALTAALPALAQPVASPRWGSFEVSLSGYRPRIDAEFGSVATPYHDAFGGGRGLMFRTDVAYSIFSNYGSLDIGIGSGYFEKYGKGLLPDGTRSADSTALKIVPTRLSLTYRFDLLAVQYSIPLAPYARVSFDRYWWWVDNGAGNTAQADTAGKGATNGYSFSAGVAFMLNFLDPALSRDMDRETGINQTYVFVDFTKSYIADFGSTRSWDLSDDQITIAGGLLFVF